MSATIYLTYVKPDPLVEWYEESAEVTALIDSYKSDGRMIEQIVEDVDGVTRKYTLTFDNLPRSLELESEPVMQSWIIARNNHNTTNNITVTKTYGPGL